MMRLVAHLDWTRFPTRTWIVSHGDMLSEHRALQLERTIASGQVRPPSPSLSRCSAPALKS